MKYPGDFLLVFCCCALLQILSCRLTLYIFSFFFFLSLLSVFLLFSSCQTETLSQSTLPGLVALQKSCDQEMVTMTGGKSMSSSNDDGSPQTSNSISKQLKMFQLTLTRKFLTCGFLQKRLKGVDMLMEWIHCARLNDAAAAAAATTPAVAAKKKNEKTDSDESEDSDAPRPKTRYNYNRYNNTYNRNVYSTGGRYGGTYSYGGGYGNRYDEPSDDEEEDEAVPDHALWITMNLLLEWMVIRNF